MQWSQEHNDRTIHSRCLRHSFARLRACRLRCAVSLCSCQSLPREATVPTPESQRLLSRLSCNSATVRPRRSRSVRSRSARGISSACGGATRRRLPVLRTGHAAGVCLHGRWRLRRADDAVEARRQSRGRGRKDEYVCDGGDLNHDVYVKPDWTVVGLDQQDTIGSFQHGGRPNAGRGQQLRLRLFAAVCGGPTGQHAGDL